LGFRKVLTNQLLPKIRAFFGGSATPVALPALAPQQEPSETPEKSSEEEKAVAEE